MNAKLVALLSLLSLGGSALAAQPPNLPPPDQYQASDSYAQPADSYAAQPAAYDPQPPDQYAPDQGGAVDETYFYDQLSPYGHWVESRYHGWVWLPYGIRAGWRPYALGHWVMTDYGWTWVSDEPFGWATYHYGRWAYDQDYGWEWIPGYEWGPAWVAWRTGGGYIGWAPLPPEVGFRVGIGLDFGGIDLNVVLGPTHFCFVEERAFLRPNVFTYVQPSARNVTIINNTTNITNYMVVNNRVVNQGIPVQHVEQVTGQRVQRLQVAAVRSVSGAAPRTGQVRGNQLTVFQPPIVRKSTSAPPPPPQTRVRASGADLQRQHQQETQALQTQQAQDRARLQQIHQREAQSPAAGAPQGGGSSNQRQRSAQEPQAPPERQQAPPERQQAPPERQQAPPERQQQAGQRQATPSRGGSSGQDLAQRHQAEVQAQQQQHQREQQQLEARHQAEQQAAQRAPQQRPPQQQRQPQQQQQQKEKKQQEKPPPPPRSR